jgi:ESCRT-I complex subunit VPS28
VGGEDTPCLLGALTTLTIQIECPRATERIRIGMPSTVEQPSHNLNNSAGAGVGSSRLIVDATENFITFLDALKLNMSSKETLHPLLSDVIQSVNKVTEGDFDHRGKIIQWLITLNQMRTTGELSEEQIRELAFDMEQAYNGFKGTIY